MSLGYVLMAFVLLICVIEKWRAFLGCSIPFTQCPRVSFPFPTYSAFITLSTCSPSQPCFHSLCGSRLTQPFQGCPAVKHAQTHTYALTKTITLLVHHSLLTKCELKYLLTVFSQAVQSIHTCTHIQNAIVTTVMNLWPQSIISLQCATIPPPPPPPFFKPAVIWLAASGLNCGDGLCAYLPSLTSYRGKSGNELPETDHSNDHMSTLSHDRKQKAQLVPFNEDKYGPSNNALN